MKSILIVDDHPLVREGMKEMLQSVRFDVSTSNGGEAALELCREWRARRTMPQAKEARWPGALAH